MRKISKRINDDDYIGKTFNLLTVISTEDANGLGKARKAMCKCICGNYKKVAFQDLRNGHTKSCGCLKRERIISYSTKHGMSRHPLTPIYSAMIQRCTNPENDRYRDYGGRGITICEEWRNNNTLFFKWALNNGWKQGLEIDREDNEKGYSPENCRIVTEKVQQRNKRNNRMITYKGETKSLAEWCELLKLSYSAMLTRIHKHNPTPEILFETPYRYRAKP